MAPALVAGGTLLVLSLEPLASPSETAEASGPRSEASGDERSGEGEG